MSVELITIIPANTSSSWEPKHTKARIEKTRIRNQDRKKAADNRRAVAKRVKLGKVVSHNVRVKNVSKKSSKTADQLIANLLAAEQRRMASQHKALEKLSAHHNRVMTVSAAKKSSPPSPSNERVMNAQLRRQSLLNNQNDVLKAHHQKVSQLLTQWRDSRPSTNGDATSAIVTAAADTLEQPTNSNAQQPAIKSSEQKWIPRHTKARMEHPKIRDHERVKAAEFRRAASRRAMLSKVVSHNAKVKAVSKRLAKKPIKTGASPAVKAAIQRRELLQQQHLEKLSIHHKKVSSLKAAMNSPKQISTKVQEAAERRESQLANRNIKISAHNQMVTTRHSVWKDTKSDSKCE